MLLCIHCIEDVLIVFTIIFTIDRLVSLKSLRRFIELLFRLIRVFWIYRRNGVNEESHYQAANVIVALAQKYGGFWGKLGQMISMRDEVFTPEWIQVMNQCHDELPVVPFSKMRPIIERELGDSIKNLFVSFDEKPIGSATISQVYKAQMMIRGRVHTVAVKVQHQNIRQELLADIWWFNIFTKMARLFLPVTLLESLRIYISQISNELDFVAEVDNIEKMAFDMKGLTQLREDFAVPFTRQCIPEDEDILESGTHILIKFLNVEMDSTHFPGQIIGPGEKKYEYKVRFNGGSFDMVRHISDIMLHGDDQYIDVNIPIPYREFCTKKVIVMEYCEGITLNNIATVQKKLETEEELFDQLYMVNRAFLYQLFLLGCCHADPHCGNVIIAGREKPPAIIDFGLFSHFDINTVVSFAKCTYGATQFIPPMVFEGLAELNFHPSSKSNKSAQEQMLSLIEIMFGASLVDSNASLRKRSGNINRRTVMAKLDEHGMLDKDLVTILRVSSSIVSYSSKFNTKPCIGIFSHFSRECLKKYAPETLKKYE